MASDYARALRKYAKELGYKVTVSRANHFKLTHEKVDGAIYASSTPSDVNTLRNVKANMRRCLDRGVSNHVMESRRDTP